MLSYNWSTKGLIQKLKAKLLEAGLSTWMDEDDIGTGSLNQSMATAVEQSAVVLICYSFGYRWSVNCKKEAEYAEVRKVPLIFVRAEENYQPDGWLGLLLGQKLYIDLIKDFDQKSAELIIHINKLRSQPNKPSPVTPKPTVPRTFDSAEGTAGSAEQSVKTLSHQLGAVALDTQNPQFLNWTVEQVQTWLKNNGLEFLLSPY